MKVDRTIETIFKLASMYDPDSVKLDRQTVDRKEGDFSIIVVYDNRRFKTAESLYNYITSADEGLRSHSDVKDFKSTEVNILSMHSDKGKLISTIEFGIGYKTFQMQTIKEIL